jgi:hypothetical protein
MELRIFKLRILWKRTCLPAGRQVPAFRYILHLSGFKNLTGVKMPLQSGLEERLSVYFLSNLLI